MELDFDKMNGLVPAIIQDNETRKVLMLGFMNKEAYGRKEKKAATSFMWYLSKRIVTTIPC